MNHDTGHNQEEANRGVLTKTHAEHFALRATADDWQEWWEEDSVPQEVRDAVDMLAFMADADRDVCDAVENAARVLSRYGFTTPEVINIVNAYWREGHNEISRNGAGGLVVSSLFIAAAIRSGLGLPDDAPVDVDTDCDDDPVVLIEEAYRARHRVAVQTLRENAAARQDAQVDDGPSTPLSELGTSLAELADENDDAPTWRIDGLLSTGGNVVFAAQRKAGKTTTVSNLLRALVDGEDFLPGTNGNPGYRVNQLTADERVAVIDLEMPRGMLRNWLTDQGIESTENVHVIALRGQSREFNLDTRLDEWATYLRDLNVKVLVIDPLAPILAAHGISENDNDGLIRLTNLIDELKLRAGVDEVLVVHHMGHGAERSRGGSRLRDWPDAEWFQLRERTRAGEEPPADAVRFFKAEGRDVMVPETRLAYDVDTRHLMVDNGQGTATRTQHTATKNRVPVMDAVTTNPGVTRNVLVRILQRDHGISQAAAKEAIAEALSAHQIHHHPGKNKSHHHYLDESCVECSGRSPVTGARL
jgi:hypothetical protein